MLLLHFFERDIIFISKNDTISYIICIFAAAITRCLIKNKQSMKRLLLTFAVLSTFALTANAQDVRKFTYDVGGYWVKLDTKSMRFLMDICLYNHIPWF